MLAIHLLLLHPTIHHHSSSFLLLPPPIYMQVYLMYWQVGPLLINGADHYLMLSKRYEDCDASWWKDLLYLRHYTYSNQLVYGYNPKLDSGSNACLVSSWYLSGELGMPRDKDIVTEW